MFGLGFDLKLLQFFFGSFRDLEEFHVISDDTQVNSVQQTDEESENSELMVTPRTAEDKILEILMELMNQTVIKVVKFWELLDYDGEPFNINDVQATYDKSKAKIAVKGRCLVCSKFIVFNKVNHRSVGMFNYKHHVSQQHAATTKEALKSAQAAKEQKKGVIQTNISSFFSRTTETKTKETSSTIMILSDEIINCNDANDGNIDESNVIDLENAEFILEDDDDNELISEN